MTGTENFMTKIKSKNRKGAPAVAVQRMVWRLYPSIMAAQEVPLLWKHYDYKMACCDCHLVHRFRFTVKGQTIFIQGWRDNRATAQLRRKRGKTPNESSSPTAGGGNGGAERKT